MKSKTKSLLVILALGASALSYSGCMSASVAKQKWEYQIIGPQVKQEAKLAEAGKEGWMLVSVLPANPPYNTYYLMRPLSQK